MDFELLYNLIPKPSQTWSVNDIEIWLRFIGLEQYIDQFRAASVDGSCLAELTEQDIHFQLKITSKIITKKIMTWIKQGIQRYDQFLDNHDRLKQTSLSKSMPPRSQIRSREGLLERSYRMRQREPQKIQELYEFNESSPERFSRRRQTAQLEAEKSQCNELIIKQCESSIFSCYSLKQQGGMIGRNSKNEIHVVDQNVSRFHAQIQYDAGIYSIKDCGSSSGTFIRISEKTQLKHDHIIEMGSNQFLIDLSNVKCVLLKVVEGPNAGQTFVAQLPKGKANIGRKSTNDFSFPEDQHLSNMHSTIFSIEGVWYIEDLGTTNGTWIRLSQESVKSEKHKLQNGTQFKLGSSLTFECQLNESNRKTEKEKSDKCQFCRMNERDCIFMPCKHNVSCHKCSQENEITNCVSCGSEILEYMKIYKV